MSLSTASLQALARRHIGDKLNASDRFCLAQSIEALDERGDDAAARYWAIKSLKHSVGIFHADYRKASA